MDVTCENCAEERQPPKRPVEQIDHDDVHETTDRKQTTGDHASGRSVPPLPLLLPWTDRVTLVSAILEVTGAKKPDARILARVVEILRERGGEAPLAALTRNPMRLQSILSHHARLLEVQLGSSS